MTQLLPSATGEADRVPTALRRVARELEESRIRAIAVHGMSRPDTIALWFGEADLPTPEFIREAAYRSLQRGETFYTPGTGLPALREAVARYQRRLYGTAFDSDHITITLSGTNALVLAMQSCIGPGDKVVAIEPVFPSLAAVPKLLGAEVTLVPLSKLGGTLKLDLDRLFSAAGDARALIVNSPNNPTGWMASAAELQAILEFSRSRGIWIISDEVYARLVYSGSCAPSFCQFMQEDDLLIVANSFSKTWCMTGWRLGWLTAPKALLPIFRKLMEFNVSCAPAFVQSAAIAAIELGEPFLAATIARYDEARSAVLTYLSALPRVQMYEPVAAFYAFFALQGLEDDSCAFIRRMIDEGGVGVAPGEAFGPSGRGHLRLCYGIEPARLRMALERMTPFLR